MKNSYWHLKSRDRGHASHGWLESYHTFSFADYYDETRLGFGTLRVINEDYIEAGAGFPMHSHRDMEIVTVLVEGALEHKDSMANSTVIRPGEVQRMSAGTGVQHSEFNHYKDRKAHLLQIWIHTAKPGIEPSYGQKSFAEALQKKPLVLALSQDAREDSLLINQDVDFYMAKMSEGQKTEFAPRAERRVWLQLIKGGLLVNEQRLESGDALAVQGTELLRMQAISGADFLLMDLAD